MISGYYGFANAGDEAMLTAIIESLQASGEKRRTDRVVRQSGRHCG
ncbi:MAG: hypothetical protein ACLRXQ_10845 [Phascolarctobacterium faecium]